MKYLTLILLVVCIACQQRSDADQTAQTQSPPIDALTGAWRMVDYLQVTDNGDTIANERVQYKMYVDGRVMWGFESPENYTEWFGYGTYEIDGDSLYETMTSGSWAFRQAISGQNNFFRIGIDIKENSYTQVIVEDTVTTYETYERLMF